MELIRASSSGRHQALRLILLSALFLVAIYGRIFKEIENSLGVGIKEHALTLSALRFHVTEKYNERDSTCPFRHSPLYHKIYVYPTYNGSNWIDDGFTPEQLRQIVSDVRMHTLNNGEYSSESPNPMPAYPWVYWDNVTKTEQTLYYHPRGTDAQYTTDLLFRSLLTHPKSCLRTYDPEEAALFYVPYIASVEFRLGQRWPPSMETSPHAQALIDIVTNNDFSSWKELWGLTSRYWERRNGADHILVYPEPLHGLWHPRNKRGSFHFINSQYQLKPPIAIGVELSTAFVKKYPKCAAKNILVPYPNPDGRWYNGVLESEASKMIRAAMEKAEAAAERSPAPVQGMFPQEKRSYEMSASSPQYSVGWDKYNGIGRPVGYYYSAGAHGTCANLRKAINQDYQCSSSKYALNKIDSKIGYHHGMLLSTFCVCPGGDSPSAKRMFDCVLAGGIPVILSKDFIWPFSNEVLPDGMDSRAFSVRLTATDFEERRLDYPKCNVIDDQYPPLQVRLEQITAAEIKQLRIGLKKAATAYSWFRHVGVDEDANDISYAEYTHRGETSDEDDRKTDLPEYTLVNDVFPDGGLAHLIVDALAKRADGSMWRECEEELKVVEQGNEPYKFEC